MMNVFVFWFVCLILFLHTQRGNCYCEDDDNIVRVMTKLGYLTGVTVNAENWYHSLHLPVSQFLGVPYAKPPVGDLRFRRPVKVEPWTPRHSMFLCMPKACVQSKANSIWPWHLNNSTSSEDCLRMNIWVPQVTRLLGKKPVLFFIPGGGITSPSGSISDPVYDGKTLAGMQEIIVVIPNYRVGTLGFWSTRYSSEYPAYSRFGRAPGNVGIWDVIMALEWVYDHIESLGGDRDRITVAGQGFGSVIASLLSITYEAKPLFKRLILQSGSAMWQYNKNISHNLDVSMDIAEKMGCADKDVDVNKDEDKIIDCMLKKEAQDLAEAEEQTDGFYPVYGDDLFESDPRIEILKHDFMFSDLLVGFTGNEGLPLFLKSHPEEDVFQKDHGIKRSVDKIEGQSFQFQNLSEPYPPRLHKRDSLEDSNWKVNDSLEQGDYTVICPAIYYAQASEKNGATIYLYQFNFRPSKSVYADWIEAAHFDEMEFVFGVPHKNWKDYPKIDRKKSGLMMAMWGNFIKDGWPTVYWPKFESCNYYRIMSLGERYRPEANDILRLRKSCEFYRTQY